tara:strand:+ start:3290 stop:3628 length:339 start_codon:yes stop_codon:yes gene_type:complete
MLSLIYSFWYGKVSLWKSYWLVGELLNGLILLIIFNVEIYFFKNSNIIKSLPFYNFYSFNFLSKFLFVLWTVYITVGIWRSAENYKGNFIWIVLTLIILSYRIFTLRLIFFS